MYKKRPFERMYAAIYRSYYFWGVRAIRAESSWLYLKCSYVFELIASLAGTSFYLLKVASLPAPFHDWRGSSDVRKYYARISFIVLQPCQGSQGADAYFRASRTRGLVCKNYNWIESLAKRSSQILHCVNISPPNLLHKFVPCQSIYHPWRVFLLFNLI